MIISKRLYWQWHTQYVNLFLFHTFPYTRSRSSNSVRLTTTNVYKCYWIWSHNEREWKISNRYRICRLKCLIEFYRERFERERNRKKLHQAQVKSRFWFQSHSYWNMVLMKTTTVFLEFCDSFPCLITAAVLGICGRNKMTADLKINSLEHCSVKQS